MRAGRSSRAITSSVASSNISANRKTCWLGTYRPPNRQPSVRLAVTSCCARPSIPRWTAAPNPRGRRRELSAKPNLGALELAIGGVEPCKPNSARRRYPAPSTEQRLATKRGAIFQQAARDCSDATRVAAAPLRPSKTSKSRSIGRGWSLPLERERPTASSTSRAKRRKPSRSSSERSAAATFR